MNRIKEIVKRLLNDIKLYGAAAVVFLAYYGIVHLFKSAFCPMLQITGLPCAGCGLTRAFIFMFRGEFVRAAYIHPLAYVIAAFVIYCGFYRYIRGTKIYGFKYLFVILIITMLIFYVIRMALYFPDRVPYVYASDNILADRLPEYEKAIQWLIQKLRVFRQ